MSVTCSMLTAHQLQRGNIMAKPTIEFSDDFDAVDYYMDQFDGDYDEYYDTDAY